MPLLLALLFVLLPAPAFAVSTAAASAGESATFILRAVGIAIQLVGFATIATSLWRVALPPADGDRKVASLLAMMMIGAVMVGLPESMGNGMFARTAADIPETARPVEAAPSSPIGTSIDPSVPTVAHDATLWDSLNAPIGGLRAEGVARISLLQVLLTLVGMVALLVLALALRSQADDEDDNDGIAERRRARAEKARAARLAAGGGMGGGSSAIGEGGDGLLALFYSIRAFLLRWYEILKDVWIEGRIRLEAFLRRIGIVVKTEGGTAAVSMMMAEVRAGGSDVLSRVEGYVERASEKTLSRGGGSARSSVNAGWILRSHGIKSKSTAAAGDLADRIGLLIEGRLDREEISRRLLHVLDRVDLGAPEIWVERVESRWFLVPEGKADRSSKAFLKVDAVRVDWVASAACWTLRPKDRIEIRGRSRDEEDGELPEAAAEGTDASTSAGIRSMVRGLQQRFAQ